MASATTRVVDGVKRPGVIAVVLFVLLLVLMQIAVAGGYVSGLLLAKPTDIFGALVVGIQSGPLLTDLFATARRVAMTFVLCIIYTVVLSLLFWRYDSLRRAYLPMIAAIMGTPIILGYLALVAIFGRGDIAIVLITSHAAIPMIVNTTDALNTINSNYVKVARSLDAEKRQIMRKVVLPDAASDIFAGVRIGFTYIMISTTGVEFLLHINEGLGGQVAITHTQFKVTEMYAAIALIILIVVVSVILLRRAEEVIRR